MKYIRIEEFESEGIVFDVGVLSRFLQRIPDQRAARGKRYTLATVLLLMILAKLSGEDHPYGIAEWARARRQSLVAALGLERSTMPGHNTYRRIMATGVLSEALQKGLGQYLYETYGGHYSILVVLDGKTLRGTIPKGKTQGVHLLAAYLPEEGIVLLQVEVGAKENEITAAPRLLSALDLRGRVVCGDAMFTQRDLSVQILAQGGDYIWFVKDNQSQLLADVVQFFAPPRKAPSWQATPLPQTTAGTTEKLHGRLEQRTITVIEDETGFLKWPGVRQVFKLERRVTDPLTGETQVETVYGITSCPPERASADQLLAWTRSYWGIENGLHYRRDKTLQEDATLMSHSNQAQVLAIINSLVVGLTQKLGLDNLASARRFLNAKLDAALFAYS
jgi:predicted transposase YbfD/YdcC